MPSQVTVAAQGAAEMPLFRSISARENQGRTSYGVACEKRRSTSFDETHGELARLCASAQAADMPDSIKKKSSFWHSRVWRFAKGKKGAMEAVDTKEVLLAISEKEESTVPKWKKIFHKLRSRAKDARKPAICSSNLDLQVANHDAHVVIRGECKSKTQMNQAEKQQRLYSVYPEPIVVSQTSTAAPIWERRRFACPPTLDLNDLKVTGLKHLPGPHQYKG